MSHGFVPISTANYLVGDVAVFDGPPGGTADPSTGIPYGHIQMYNGSKWVSNFMENNFYPGGSYQDNNTPYQIYRWNGN